MTRKYYEDSYNYKDLAKIINIEDYGDLIGIELEETIFFPGGGGQPSDIGYLEYDGKVLDIKKLVEDGDRILHMVDKSCIDEDIAVGKDVLMCVDEKNRLDGMCQHSAQHLLSGIIYNKFNNNTTGLHIGKMVTQLDVEGEYSDDEIAYIEDEANSIIHKNIGIKNYILDKTRADVYTRRPIPNTPDDVRILEIEGIDINACCGVHVRELKDISAIKIKKFYKNKNGTRIEFLAGYRAISYMLDNDRVFSRILKSFNSSQDTVEKAISNLELKRDRLYREKELIMNKYVDLYINSILSLDDDILNTVKIEFDEEDSWMVKDFSSKLLEKKDVVLFIKYKENNRYYLLAQTTKNVISKNSEIDLISSYKSLPNNGNVKGGGNKNMISLQSSNEEDIDYMMNELSKL